jgi:hypothetical protein
MVIFSSGSDIEREVLMRLTLRTLLAYMDDILDPADHEELAKKIEASDFAGELIHRSRDTVRRLRLGAPEVFAGEDDDVLNPDPASDGNSVAEYLDNTLAPERVAEFERVCLDSGTVADMHLAEVTSCHHILTMVLGEPAEIDPQVRRRMYELPQRVEGGDKLRIESAHPPITVSPPAADAAPIVAAPPKVAAMAAPAAAPAPVVLPDYLRVAAESRRRRYRLATIAALFVIGCGAAFLFIPTKEPEVPDEVANVDADAMLSDLQIGEMPAEDMATADDTDNIASETENEAPRFDDAAPAEDDEQASAVPPAEDAAVPAEDVAPAEQTEAAAPEPIADDTTDTEPTATDTQPIEPIVQDETAPPIAAESNVADNPAPTEDVDQSVAATVGPASEPDAPVASPPQERAELEPQELEETTTEPVVEGDPLGIEGTEAESDQGPPEPPGPVQVGVYVGNNDVLLRLVPDTAQWLRLPPRSTIAAGDTLLALPKYRTHVVLKNVNSYLSGGTQITLPEQDGDDAKLAIEMSYGRLLLNAGLKGSDVSMKIGEATREFRLDNSASLAVEVRRIFVPGTDYSQQVAPFEVIWHLTSGSVQWNAAGEKETIKAPASWSSLNGTDEPAAAVAEFPNWIDREPMTELERRARDRFAEDLPVGQPVGLRLEEINAEEGAGREIRTLSAEASLFVGEFEPFVKSLNDSDLRVAWRSHIAAMRQALGMDPMTAAKLQQAFIDIRGQEDGEMLFAMVRGFTPEQIGTTRDELKMGIVVDLVRALEHESLDYRVLAIYNLDEIKGTKDLAGYRPDGIPRTRATAVTKIRNMIESNEFLNLP